MSIAMVLKIFSDCCVCFAILGSGPVQFDLPLLVPALLCGIAAGIASLFQEKGWAAASRMCALLPLLCLLLAESGQQALVLAVPAIYTALVILRGKLELEYYSYRRFFLQSLVLVGAAYLIVNIWIFLARATNEPQPDLDGSVILRYGLVHLFCGVVLQRQLRLGVGYRSEGGRRQMSMLLGTVGAVVLAFVLAEPLLREYAAVLMKYVLTVAVTPVMLLIELLTWVIRLFEKKQPDQQVTDATAEVSGEGAVNPVGDAIGQTVERPDAITPDPTFGWVGLVVILLLVAAVILYRSFQKRRAAGDPGEIAGRVVTPPKKKRASALSNRYRVRQLYREFLRVEKGWGLKLKICDTSADILQRIHPETDKPSANALRQVYLAARYDDRQNISRSQVSEARRALKGTRRTKK